MERFEMEWLRISQQKPKTPRMGQGRGAGAQRLAEGALVAAARTAPVKNKMKQEGKPHSRFGRARKWPIFWTLFIGLGTVGGAAMMLLDPSGRSVGMDGLLPYFQVLPFADVLFQDLTFSGFALLLVNGLMNLTAACSA